VYASTVEEARQDQTLTQAVIRGVQQVNQSLGPGHAPVKRFFILSEDLHLANNHLTPTLQLRRSVVIEKFANVIDDMYDDCLPGDRKQRQPDIPISKPNMDAANMDAANMDAAAVHRQTTQYLDGCRDLGVADVDSIDKSQVAHRDWAASEAVHSTALLSTIPTATLAVEQHRRDSQLDYGISEQQHQALSASRVEENVTLRDSPKLPHHDTHVMPEGRWAHGGRGEGEQHTAWHVQLEEAVLQTNSAISNVMVVGDDRPFLSCFISLKTAAEGTDILHEDSMFAAQLFGSTAHTVMQAKDDTGFRAFLVDSIARVNRHFGQPSSAIRKFIILLVDFLPAITKTQGPRALTTAMRDSIKSRFHKIIDTIYDGAAVPNVHTHGTPASNYGGVVSTSLNLSSSPAGFDRWQTIASTDTGAHAQEGFENADASRNLRLGSPSLQDVFKAHDAAATHNTDWYPSEFDQQAHQGVDQAPASVPRSTHAAQLTHDRLHDVHDVHEANDSNGLMDSSINGALYSSDDANVYHSHRGTPGGDNSRTRVTKDARHESKAGDELIQLVLNLDMAHVLPNMQAFCTGLHSDVCWALNVHGDQVVVRNVSAGSVIVTVALSASHDDDRSAMDLVRTLQEQATHSDSSLLQGAYTQSLKSLTHIVSTAVPTDWQAQTPRIDLENSILATMSCGVGLVLQQDDQNRVFISRLIPGSPAALTRELCDDDVVIEIDGHSMIGVAPDLVVASLKGDKGSLVRMAVMRGDVLRTVYMVRGKARDSLVAAIRVSAIADQEQHNKDTPKRILPSTPLGALEASNGRPRTSQAPYNKRLSVETASSAVSASAHSQRALQVCLLAMLSCFKLYITAAKWIADYFLGLQVVNMGFEAITVRVWRRDGDVLIDQEISPNGAFPDEDKRCGQHWPIPPGRDLCFTVLLGRETSSRKSFCLPEFDKRSVQVRVEVDSEKLLLSVAPVLRKGKPLQGNIDAYSLRLNALPETTGPAL